MEIRFPMWLRVVDRPNASVFAVLSGTDAYSRALIAGVLPLEAYRLFESARAVSMLYTAIGVTTLVFSLFVPVIIRRIGRRWVFTSGCLLMIAAAMLMALAQLPTFAAGLQCRALAVVCSNIALNLYILDHIAKKDMIVAEPRRLVAIGVAWSTGPALGIWLNTTFGPLAVFGPSALAACITLGYFWVLRLVENTAIRPMTKKPTSAFQNVRRFVAQPRMRLAWLIAFTRSTHWITFFIYPPLAIVAAGGGEFIVAVMLTVAQAMLFMAPLAGRAGRHFGVRHTLVIAFFVTGVFSAAAGFASGHPWLIAGLFVASAAGSMVLDALGNIPFLRAVHPYERAEMASVFRTYIEVSQLLPPAIYALALTFFPIEAVFIILGCQHLLSACVALKVPRGL